MNLGVTIQHSTARYFFKLQNRPILPGGPQISRLRGSGRDAREGPYQHLLLSGLREQEEGRGLQGPEALPDGSCA